MSGVRNALRRKLAFNPPMKKRWVCAFLGADWRAQGSRGSRVQSPSRWGFSGESGILISVFRPEMRRTGVAVISFPPQLTLPPHSARAFERRCREW
jgi:hypothetical protein